MSLVKYFDQHGEDSGGRGKLSFNRADLDGAPFRGRNHPLLKDDEYEDMAERVYDAGVEIFDMSDDEDKAKYQEIIDRIRNGWYELIYRRIDFIEEERRYVAYIEWASKHMELPPAAYRIGGKHSPYTLGSQG
jgi:hypothetical protein